MPREPKADRIAELKGLLGSSSRGAGITIAGRTLSPAPNTGNAEVFPGLTDVEVLQYVQELTGVTRMPAPRLIPGKGRLYVITTGYGNFNLMDFATSSDKTGPVWTVDVPADAWGETHKAEIKFIREGEYD